MKMERLRNDLREISNFMYMKSNANMQNLLNQIYKNTHSLNIQCIFTYTPSMYPRIEMSEESDVLVWDEHFFNLFDLYIRTIISEETYDNKVCLLKDLSLLMLSHRFDSIPSLSYAFAIMYDNQNKKALEKGEPNFGYYDGLFQKVNLSEQQLEISYFSRLFVMYHEIRHYMYKKNKEYNNSQAVQYLSAIRHQIYTILNPFNMPIYAGDPSHAYMINEINYMIEHQKFHVIEEFMCDLFACFDLVDLLLRTYNGKKSDEVRFTYKIASTVSMFLNESMHLFSLWENIYKNKDNGEYEKYIEKAFSFYEKDNDDVSVDEEIAKYHFRSKLLFYCLYHHYTNEDEIMVFHNLFTPEQHDLLIDGQKMTINGFNAKQLLELEQDNRRKYTPQQCRVEKDRILHWN